MSRPRPDRLGRLLDQAEGYLILGLPQRALAILDSRADWPGHYFMAHHLAGQTLLSLGRFTDAIVHLERAATVRADDVNVAIGLGWCYKRTHKLAQAIGAVERAVRIHPSVAVLHYNLACYWSLAGNVERAVRGLTRAIQLDPDFRRRADSEADFDTIRHDPRFEGLTPSASKVG